jgi:KaiC/GvpD/RAD55 family RecA-like ATPase
VSGNYSGPQPTLLRRSDGKHLIYPGKLHSFAGVPGGGKSWLAQVLSAQVITAGSIVLYVDFEDAPESVVKISKALRVSPRRIVEEE